LLLNEFDFLFEVEYWYIWNSLCLG